MEKPPERQRQYPGCLGYSKETLLTHPSMSREIETRFTVPLTEEKSQISFPSSAYEAEFSFLTEKTWGKGAVIAQGPLPLFIFVLPWTLKGQFQWLINIAGGDGERNVKFPVDTRVQWVHRAAPRPLLCKANLWHIR